MLGESESNDNVLWPLRRDEDLNKLMMIDDGRNYFVFSHKKTINTAQIDCSQLSANLQANHILRLTS